VADRSSYYALQATALNDQVSGGTGGIRLVGVPGVSLSANNLSVTINGASAPTTGGATPTGPPAPVIDFKAAGSTFGTAGFRVGIGGGDTILLDLRTRTIAASGDVTLGLDFDTDGTADVTLSSFISFQQSFRPNGSSVIKIALTNLSFVLGDPADPVFSLSGLNGLFLITPQGMAARIELPGYSTTINGSSASISISGNLAVEINTTNAVVNETFVTGANGETTTLSLQKGPFLRLSGFLSLGITFADSGVSVPFVLSGNFAFEQITLVDPNPSDTIPAPKAIRVAVSDVTATVQGVGLTKGQGGFIFSPDGLAGVLRVTIDTSTGDPGVPTLGGDVLLQINTTGRAVNQTIAVGNTVIAIKFTAQEGRVVRFAILNASVSIPPFFELTGDFTIQSEGDMTLYGARNVEIFLGSLPTGQTLRDANGRSEPERDRPAGHERHRRPDQVDLHVGDGTGTLCGLCLRRGGAGRRGRPDDQRRDHGAPEQLRPGDRPLDRAAVRPAGHGARRQQRPRRRCRHPDRRRPASRRRCASSSPPAPRPRTSRPASTRLARSTRPPRSRSARPASSRCPVRCPSCARRPAASMSTCRRPP
jgi:hypothetical protein